MPPPKTPRVLYWFRTDLRLHDSPALSAGLALDPSAFYPVWTWDPHYVYRARVGPNRWQFLLDCQNDLSASLGKLNARQKLLVVREAPQTVLVKLCQAWGVTHLVFESDTDAYARKRDEEVCEMVRGIGVEVVTRVGRTLFEPDELVRCNGGRPTMSMAQVQKAAAKIGDGVPARPIAAPTRIPDPGEVDLSGFEHEVPDLEPDVNAKHRTEGEERQYRSIMGPKGDFAVPTLEEMGIPAATTPIRGGETRALVELARYCADEEYVGTFEKPKSAPTAFAPQSTTLLSPHLHFGSLSVRKFWWDVQAVIEKRKKAKKHVSEIPVNLPGQLLFRDMYFGAQAALGWSYAQEEGNKVCRFVDWHLRSNTSDTPDGEHLLDGTYTVDNSQAEEWFQRWKWGRTGFPWIDALMRQLRTEGWIHHLGRHAVACFLTRGGCYVHWERGAEVFEEWLIDHETACNVGNWMWLSCTAFFSQFYRCYSPIAFGRKTDSEGNFIRHYVPELEKYDKKYIYEPWTAPIADQKKWGCLIKGDGNSGEEDGGVKIYHKPMFDFNERREVCIQGMKNAYRVGMYGDDPRVKDGSWKKIFKYEDQSGGAKKDETNGLVERGKRKRQDDAEAQQNGHVKPESSSSKDAKKQGTLDAHMGKKKAKK